MDTAPINTTYSQFLTQPRHLSSLEKRSIDPLIFSAIQAVANKKPEEAQACAQALQSHLDSLYLPTCPIQYVAWMHPVAGSLEKMKCVCFSFFIPSLPSPQQLWTLELPEEVMLNGAPIASLKECLRPTFSAVCMLNGASQAYGFKVQNWESASTACILSTALPSDQFYGFRVENWESALQTIERVDLSQKGKFLANEWQSALEKETFGSEAYHNHFNNFGLLLDTFVKNTICLFTQEESERVQQVLTNFQSEVLKRINRTSLPQ